MVSTLSKLQGDDFPWHFKEQQKQSVKKYFFDRIVASAKLGTDMNFSKFIYIQQLPTRTNFFDFKELLHVDGIQGKGFSAGVKNKTFILYSQRIL